MKRNLLSGIFLLAAFALFTWSLTVVNVRPIGPEGSCVGYAAINRRAHDFFGVHLTLYLITDWAGVGVILIAAGFALLGLIQWIQRKRILKVDRDILLLGAFYLMVIAAYVLFEYVCINRRPVLTDGFLEASYPSSTTVLSLCVLISAGMQAKRRIRRAKIRKIVLIFLYASAFFVVIGRLLSGVHWFTDVLGGVLFSAGALTLYSASIKS